jgi:predicted nucleotidyltransferase
MEKLSLPDEYLEFLKCLNKHKVNYLIIGAHAIMFHASFARASKDIDFWVKQSEENSQRLAEAVTEFSGSPLDPSTLLIPKQKIEIGNGEFKIELLSYLEAAYFDEAWEKKVLGNFLGEPAYFVSKDVLIKLQKLAGRSQDIADLERLKTSETHEKEQ